MNYAILMPILLIFFSNLSPLKTNQIFILEIFEIWLLSTKDCETKWLDNEELYRTDRIIPLLFYFNPSLSHPTIFL